uniref:DUF4283 domain-containing protein n=1 Tax=Setaria viridis TaxID=4556 RepID=A0A4U6U4F6_SETVI|nr:hypothetical protein SEVIR_6G168000v2 [Setaria viridis]
MAAAKLLTVKEFSEASLMSTMRSAWNTAHEVTFCPIGKNIFVVQAFCLGDWKRIMEEGPWIFRVPHLYHTKSNLKQLASKIDSLVTFGNWMIVGEETWHPVTPTVRGNIGVEHEQPKEERGDCPAKGRGRGRGGWGSYPRGGVWMEKKVGSDDGSGSRKRASEEAGLDKGTDAELSDTATSPVKPMEEKHGRSREVLAKKQLSMTAEPSNKVEICVPPPPPKYISPREKKKQKKLIETEKEVPNTTMVDSEKEDNREQ